MITGANVFIHAKPRRFHAPAFLDRRRRQRLFAALLVQHTFRRGDDHLGPRLFRRQRLYQHIAHMAHIISAVHLADPINPHALQRLGNRMLGFLGGIAGAG